MKIFIAFLEIDEKRKEKVLHHEKQWESWLESWKCFCDVFVPWS
jgi:hypothetical protein